MSEIGGRGILMRLDRNELRELRAKRVAQGRRRPWQQSRRWRSQNDRAGQRYRPIAQIATAVSPGRVPVVFGTGMIGLRALAWCVPAVMVTHARLGGDRACRRSASHQ